MAFQQVDLASGVTLFTLDWMRAYRRSLRGFVQLTAFWGPVPPSSRRKRQSGLHALEACPE